MSAGSAYSAAATARCRELINVRDYPIDDAASARRSDVIRDCRASLADDGCAVLKDFLSPTGTHTLLDEASQRRDQAYFSPTSAANVYFSSDDPSLPADHPRRVFLERTNGFITSDNFGPQTAAHLNAESRRVRNDPLLD